MTNMIPITPKGSIPTLLKHYRLIFYTIIPAEKPHFEQKHHVNALA